MAVLTWRNVDAPNLRSGIEGLAVAGRMLDNAGSGLSDALGRFGAFQTEQANNVVQQNALQYQDPAALKAALASGSILSGVDPNKVSAGTLTGLQTRVGNLIDQATSQQSLDKSTYDQNRLVQGNQLADAAQPTVNRLLAANASGDPKQIAAAQAEAAKDPAYLALRSSQLNNVLTDAQNLSGKQTQNAQAGFNLMIGERNDADQQAAQRAFNMISTSGTDAIGAEKALQGMGLSPGAYALTRSMLTRGGFADPNNPSNAALPSGTGVGGAVGGASGAGAAIANAAGSASLGVMAGGKPLPDNIRTVGDLVDNTPGLAKANGNNSSATGIYQITGSTFADFAPKVLGADWRNADVRSFDTQDKIGGAIWDTVKNSDPAAMIGRFQSLNKLPPAQLAALKGASWDQVRPIIAQGESSTSAPTLAALQQQQVNNAVSQTNLASRGSQNGTNLGFDQEAFAKAAGDDSPPAVVANRLTKDKNSVFFGQDPSVVQDMIKQVVDRSTAFNRDANGNPTGQNVNASRAAVLVESALNSGGHGFWGSIGNKYNSLFGNSLTGGQTLDSGTVDRLVQNASQGLDAGAAGAKVELTQAAQNLASASQMQQQAYQNYQNLALREASGLDIQPDAVARAKAQWTLWTNTVNQLQEQVRNGPRTQPMGQSQARAKVADAPKVEAQQKAQAVAKAQAALDTVLNQNTYLNPNVASPNLYRSGYPAAN